MEEWVIRNKTTCLVKDAAADMIACGRELNLKHTACVGHTTNLMVKKVSTRRPEKLSIFLDASPLQRHVISSASSCLLDSII